MQRSKRPFKKFPGFTLVELIVVITILVILGTIAFLSFRGYSASARDSGRIENMGNLQKGLSLFQIKSGTYPIPEDYVSITASGVLVGYQGFAKEQVAGMAGISKWGSIDPADSTMYTTYSVNGDKTKMELMAFLEDKNNVISFLPSAFAAGTSDYSKRNPLVKGDTLGILLASGTLQPMQESGSGVDILNTTGSYIMYMNQSEQFSGTGTMLRAALAGGWLIWYWSFDEGAGTTASDKSGNKNNGTLSGTSLPTWAGWKLGSALNFNGTDNYVAMSQGRNNINKLTLSAWVSYPSNVPKNNLFSFVNSSGAAIWNFFINGRSDGSYNMSYWNQLGWWQLSGVMPPLNEWVFLTWTLDNNKLRSYINGSAVNAVTYKIDWQDIAGYRIGWANGIEYGFWRMDEIRIYDRALSDTEIQVLYNSTK